MRLRRSIALLLLATAPAPACSGGGRTPSVLLLTLDTTRQDALSCYGAPDGLTPSLDRLSAEGVTYDQARTVAPITLPAHASMLTGLWPPRHGLRVNGMSRLPAAAETLAEIAVQRGFETAAFLSAAVLGSTYALDQGFEHYDEVDTRTPGARGASNDFARRGGAATVDAALAWFAGRDTSRPYFCWVHFFDPHGPWPERSPYLPLARGNPYLAQVATMDREIGRLLDALQARGELEGALVIIVGDHGESLGERGEFAHGVHCYEATIRVPLIVRHPDGARAGERSQENVSVVDVFATVCDALRAPASGADGRSLLTGELPPGRGVYFESLYGYANFGWSPLVGWVQDGRKYMHSARPEMYDLEADPLEVDDTLDASDPAPWVAALRAVHGEPSLADDGTRGPGAAELEALAALGYATGGSLQEAPDPLAETDRKSPHAAREEYGLIQEAFELIGDSERAASAWERVLELNPMNRTALAEHGYHLMQLGRWGEAAARYRALTEEGSLRSMHWVALGACLEQLGDLERAIAHYARGLELDPNNAAAREEYRRAMKLAGRGAEARRVLAETED